MIVAQRVDHAGEGYVIRRTPTTVEAWSTIRLPYPARGWLIDFRRDLGTALSALASPDGDMLHATYAGAAARSVDIENVLLYNVGARALRHLVSRGLRFERAPVPPPAPADMAQGKALHYHRYSITRPETAFAHWTPRRILASFRDVRLDQPTRIAPVFAAIRGTASPPVLPESLAARFGVRIAVSGPGAGAGRLVDLVKSLLDGAVCAYHQHDGSDLQEILSRLDHLGLGTTDALRQELLDPRWNVLGRRRLLWPRRDGVQWNPADDRCVAAEISVQDAADSRGRISAEVVDLDERP